MSRRHGYAFVERWAITESAKVTARLEVCRHPQGGWTVRETMSNTSISLYRGSFATRMAANQELHAIQQHRLQELLHSHTRIRIRTEDEVREQQLALPGLG
ncbi:MAG: hypothetical protein JNJ82_00975 [Opitutaceae bacterium]|jgi:hypothetical protein|nr:hypothetical protein [Opitutaceae bacterium]